MTPLLDEYSRRLSTTPGLDAVLEQFNKNILATAGVSQAMEQFNKNILATAGVFQAVHQINTNVLATAGISQAMQQINETVLATATAGVSQAMERINTNFLATVGMTSVLADWQKSLASTSVTSVLQGLMMSINPVATTGLGSAVERLTAELGAAAGLAPLVDQINKNIAGLGPVVEHGASSLVAQALGGLDLKALMPTFQTTLEWLNSVPDLKGVLDEVDTELKADGDVDELEDELAVLAGRLDTAGASVAEGVTSDAYLRRLAAMFTVLGAAVVLVTSSEVRDLALSSFHTTLQIVALVGWAHKQVDSSDTLNGFLLLVQAWIALNKRPDPPSTGEP